MGIAIFVLSIIGFLGFFSLWQNSRKKTVITKVIDGFITRKKAKLIRVEIPNNSGPFNDKYYNEKQKNLYENIGYESKETIYRKVFYRLPNNSTTKVAWLQLRVEKLKATYMAWKREEVILP